MGKRDTELNGEKILNQTKHEIAKASRQLGQEVASLPGVSAIGDILTESTGVRELAARLKDDPDDPMRCVQLVEAMAALEQRAGKVREVKSWVNPMGYVVGAVLRKAATLDQDKKDRPVMRLCRRATALAIRRLRVDPSDSEALHAAARTELVRERPEQAARLAKRAILVSKTPPAQPIVTLARAYHCLGRLQSAQRAANLALEAGSSLGFEVLVGLLQENKELKARVRKKRIEALNSMVREEDRKLYYGVTKSKGEIARQVAGRQIEKVLDTGQRFKSFFDRQKKKLDLGKLKD
jgi:hypothetical protein